MPRVDHSPALSSPSSQQSRREEIGWPVVRGGFGEGEAVIYWAPPRLIKQRSKGQSLFEAEPDAGLMSWANLPGGDGLFSIYMLRRFNKIEDPNWL